MCGSSPQRTKLEEAIAAGTFREDLYYRLLRGPAAPAPLRERGGDLDLLLAAFHGTPVPRARLQSAVYAPETMERLRRYPWPGNVRELRNFAERMVILFGGQDCPPRGSPAGNDPAGQAGAVCRGSFRRLRTRVPAAIRGAGPGS